MTYGISLTFFPTLWEVGKARIRNKTVLAFGPFRVSIHRVQGTLASYQENGK